MSDEPVAVTIQGREYRIRSDGDESWLTRVADCVDVAMGQVRDRTATVDSLDVAVLTSLNLAREVLEFRAGKDSGREVHSGGEAPRIKAMIELVESAMESEGPQSESGTALLTLPAGDELEFEAETGELLEPELDTGDRDVSPTRKKARRR